MLMVGASINPSLHNCEGSKTGQSNSKGSAFAAQTFTPHFLRSVLMVVKRYFL